MKTPTHQFTRLNCSARVRALFESLPKDISERVGTRCCASRQTCRSAPPSRESLFAILPVSPLLAFLLIWIQVQTAGDAVESSKPGRNDKANATQRSEFDSPGFVVVAPDRGFLGNVETEEAFDLFAKGRNAQLVFATDERTRIALDRAIQSLVKAGARQTVVLPLFLSPSDPRFALVRSLVAPSPAGKPGNWPIPVSVGGTFGESYLAVEVLADRFREIHNPNGRRVVVVGYGAKDAASRRSMESDGQRLAEKAAEGFGFESVHALVWYDSSLPNYDQVASAAQRSLQEIAQGGERVVVVPFHLGKKLDGMMSFTASLRRFLPAGAELLSSEVTPHPAVATWMTREANKHIPIRSVEIGVVFLAHGSDYHWNETMRESVQSLVDDYRIEFAFCMADPPLVERAVRRLEQRGARAIVIVRVFGLAASFKASVERMIGLDVELEAVPAAPAGHGHGQHQHAANQGQGDDHGHGHQTGGPLPRIRSSALLTTVGGLEDHPFFAEALFDRARALSVDPSRETIILVAHGSGDDGQNEHWRRRLESLAGRMRANGGAKFKAIPVATWREDWPDKRAAEVAGVRRMVEEASRGDGRVIVIPARTTDEGFEKKFLEGLRFELGSGFAPHPLFVRWFEEQVRTGISALRGVSATADRGQNLR